MKAKDMKSRSIGQVKLIDGGLRGIEVMYQTTDIEDGMVYGNELVEKKHRPVTREVKKYMQELKDYFLELCGYNITGPNEDSLVPLRMCTEVTGVKGGANSFLITGKIRSWEEKTIGLSAPMIKRDVDGFEDFDKVMEIVDKLYAEVSLYMKGKKVKKEEIIEDYVRQERKQEGFVYQDFESWDQIEKDKLLKEMEKDLMLNFTEENGELVATAAGDNDIDDNVPEIATMPAMSDDKFESDDDDDLLLPAFPVVETEIKPKKKNATK
jgi:hypothetical protein